MEREREREEREREREREIERERERGRESVCVRMLMTVSRSDFSSVLMTVMCISCKKQSDASSVINILYSMTHFFYVALL